jgi:hypothetical protein
MRRSATKDVRAMQINSKIKLAGQLTGLAIALSSSLALGESGMPISVQQPHQQALASFVEFERIPSCFQRCLARCRGRFNPCIRVCNRYC